jgi:hypothetical protein
MIEPANSNFPAVIWEPVVELRSTVEQVLERLCYTSF